MRKFVYFQKEKKSKLICVTFFPWVTQQTFEKHCFKTDY